MYLRDSIRPHLLIEVYSIYSYGKIKIVLEYRYAFKTRSCFQRLVRLVGTQLQVSQNPYKT